MILRKLRQMIKQAVVVALLPDDTPYPRSFANHSGKDTYYTRLSPYGLDTHPPKGAHVLLFSANGQESNKFGIASDMLHRFKDLSEYEVVLYNTDTKDYIYLKANGDIEIDSKHDIHVNAANNVSVTAGGDITASAGGDAEIEASGSIAASAGTTLSATAVTSAIITAPTITLSGNVVIAGTLSQTGGGASQFSGDVSTTGNVSSGSVVLGSHVHTGVQTGSSNTGGPI